MPGGKGNIKPSDNPKPFKKGNNANPKGRPKKLIGTVNMELEKKGYSEPTKQEIISCYLRLINTDEAELISLTQDKEQPYLVKSVAENILSGKGFDIIERLLDRAIGKAVQGIDHTTNGKDIDKPTDLSKLTTEELLQLRELNAKISDH